MHETLPQTALPVMPLLKDELEVEGDKQRGAAVDLVAHLLTAHPGGGAIVEEYGALLDALLKRACDKAVRGVLCWMGAGCWARCWRVCGPWVLMLCLAEGARCGARLPSPCSQP